VVSQGHPRWALRGPCTWGNPRARVWGALGLPPPILGCRPPPRLDLVGGGAPGRLGGGGVSSPPPSYIRRLLGGELDMCGLRKLLGRSLLPSPPHAPPLSYLSLSLVWLPEGLRRSEGDSTAARRSAARILDEIQTDLLLCRAAGILDRIQTDLLSRSRLDPRSGRSHRSPYVYEYYEVLHVWH
jgi:hypothetical protein